MGEALYVARKMSQLTALELLNGRCRLPSDPDFGWKLLNGELLKGEPLICKSGRLGSVTALNPP